jgi:hypothetical protein
VADNPKLRIIIIIIITIIIKIIIIKIIRSDYKWGLINVIVAINCMISPKSEPFYYYY